MIRYTLGRLAMLPLSLLAVSFATFSFLHLAPGDVIDTQIGEDPSITAEQRQQLAHELGLDRPFIVQYGDWVREAVRGDLGTSTATHRPVLDELLPRIGMSMQLAVLALALALVIGIGAGALATRWRHGWFDRSVLVASTIGMSLPNFLISTLLVLGLSLYLPSIGVVSYVPLGDGVLASVGSIFFPALSIALATGATLCRYMRGATEDILRSADYVRTAKAKGSSPRRVLWREVVPNSLVPVTTVAGLQFAYLIGGTVLIETIWALPGVGQMIMSGVTGRDYPLVQGGVLVMAAAYTTVNLAVDLLYPILDPSVRLRATS